MKMRRSIICGAAMVLVLAGCSSGGSIDVTFDKNGGDTEAAPRVMSVQWPSATLGSLPATNPTWANHTFVNWNTKADGSGSLFTASTVVNASLTVYAQWTGGGPAPDPGVDVAGLAAYLSGLSANTPETPYTVKLASTTTIDTSDTSENGVWATINNVTKTAGKYVILDLSVCTVKGNSISGSSDTEPSGNNQMNIIKNNASIKGIVLPDKLTSIGEYAFGRCTSLTSVTIPASVESIDERAFVNCTGLISITVAAGNANYASEDGVLFNNAKTTLIQYPAGKTGTSYKIPSSVASIGLGAFAGCSGLTSVTIPADVKSIGLSAFMSCSGLTSVTIPGSVESIGDYAFYGCTSLTSVTFAEGSAIADGNFGSYAFPQDAEGSGGDSLKTEYQKSSGGAGTYTRAEEGDTWTKQP